ncbi:flavoprotein-like protein [Pyrenochaeta sp. MPI-SDFR-AT-0127]|nr:flavoprotein-like protein [Pyrenochaeta sp. MPI-SDFR-AT-0127]
MHILGLVNGSKGGNSEILAKAALQAAKEKDASITTSWIHVPSVAYPRNSGPLKGAPDVSAGTNASNNTNGTTPNEQEAARDDRLTVFNAILDADAILYSTAVYSHQPAGALKALLDTLLGPYTDPALATRIVEGQKNGDPKYGKMKIDPRILKPRIAGFLAVGGSTTPDQFTMALPTLHLLAYSLHMKVVDQMVYMGCTNPGAVLKSADDAVMKRTQDLGRNLASQIGKTFDDAEYLGPRPEGACPHCHLSKMDYFGGPENSIGCVVCGTTGTLVVAEGKIVPSWDQDSEYCCITMKGKQKHIDDIFKNGSAEWKGFDSDAGFKKTLDEWRGVDAGQIRFDA